MIRDNVFMDIAILMANQSHCRSYKVAAIAVKDQRIVATGINGTLPGALNCDDIIPEKPDLWDVPAVSAWRAMHREYSLSNEIHAEQNMVADAARRGVVIDGCTVYVTHGPCQYCTKLLAAAGIKNIIYANDYDYAGNYDILHNAGIKITKLGAINE